MLFITVFLFYYIDFSYNHFPAKIKEFLLFVISDIPASHLIKSSLKGMKNGQFPLFDHPEKL